MPPKRVERAGLDQRFDRRPARAGGIDPLAEVEQVLERPALAAGGDDRLARAAAAALDRRQAELNLAVGHGEIDVRAVHVGRQHLDPHPLAIFHVLDQRILRLKLRSSISPESSAAMNSTG